MGFGRFNSIYKKLHKRKRTAAVTPKTRQEEESPNTDDWAERESASAASSAHRHCWNKDMADDDRCSDDDDDYAASSSDGEGDGSLSAMCCGEGLSEVRGKYTQSREEEGDGRSRDHESRLCYNDEDERVSMELDTDLNGPSQYCLLNSPGAGGSFRHSSGRPILRQETSMRHTIEYEFEEYFAALLLK